MKNKITKLLIFLLLFSSTSVYAERVPDDLYGKWIKLNEKKDYSYNSNIKKIVAPINKGDVIGSVEIVDDNNTKIGQVNLTVSTNIKKQNIVGFYFSFIKKIIRGF